MEMECSNYTYAEKNMILCMTRERTCTPEQCKTCGWENNETKEFLKKHGDEHPEMASK